MHASLGLIFKFGQKKKKVQESEPVPVVEEWATRVDTIWYDDVTYKEVPVAEKHEEQIYFEIRKSEPVPANQVKAVADFVKADADWASKFHVWRMDWDESAIRLYVDGLLLNTVELKKTVNGKAEGQGVNPFTRPQYILLNLAIGGMNGGKIDDSMMPMKYEIDYVRVYQKKQ